MEQKKILNNYFENNWQVNYTKFKYSGWALAERVKPSDRILDIGCGYNLFKGPFGDRVYGIDPANSCADERVSIEDFNSARNKWDVVFCLGSLNFGDETVVKPQVEKAVSLCKKGGRIFWRQNPGLGDHPWKGVEEIKFFPWSEELNYQWAKEFDCEVVFMDWEPKGNRLYAEWVKN